MKKLIALLLVAALSLMGLCAMAEEKTEGLSFKFTDLGVKLNFPEVFKNTKGVIAPMMAGELFDGAGLYMIVVSYIAMDHDAYNAINDKDELTEEEHEQFQNSILDLVTLVGLKDGFDTSSLNGAEEMQEIGRSGDITWYNGSDGNSDKVPDSAFAEEYAELFAAVPEVYAMSEFGAPEDVYAAMEGKHIEFTTADLDGNAISSADLFSQHAYTALNIWATWCGYCVAEMPELEALNNKLADVDCAVVGLLHDSTNEKKLEKAKGIMEENGAHYAVIQAPEGVDDLFVTLGFPTTYIVDREGNVVGRPFVGTPVKEIEAKLMELAGK